MFIETEQTPNPQTVKFLPQGASWDKTALGEWKSAGAADGHPLAAMLFATPFVARVFLGADFIAITKNDQFAWEQIKPDILSALLDFFAQGGAKEMAAAAEGAEPSAAAGVEPSGAESAVEKKIREVLAERVQPAVAQDGGDIQLARFENGVAYLNMRGACAGCPSSTITLKNGVENLLRYYVPELERVEATESF